MKKHTYRIVGLGLILASGCNQILGLNQGEPLPMEKGGNASTGGAGGVGGAMPQCDANNPCDDQNACTYDSCNALGMCEFSSNVDGSPPPGYVDMAGDCVTHLCVNGLDTTLNDDLDVPDDMNACTSDTCTVGIPSNPPTAPNSLCSVGDNDACDGLAVCKKSLGKTCGAGAECVSANCVDGVCCDNACTGTCHACSVAGSVGVCSDVPFGQDDVGTCSGATQSCDDFGGCKKENGQLCSGNTDCWSNICNGGACTEKSCIGLPATCGPQTNENCCVSSVVTGGTYNRSNDAMYPATVSTFRLDRFEITVGRFRKFVEAYPGSKPASGAGAHPLIAGSGWDVAWSLAADLPALKAELNFGLYQTWTDTPATNENLPINSINWYLSFAFCAWDGGRMPTEAEWNYAASGGIDQRQYPWSNPPTSTTIDATYAAYDCLGDGSSAGTCAFADILKVGSKSNKGDGKWGQADLSGSMAEWNLDRFQSPYPMPCSNCANILNGSSRVLRGGDWFNGVSSLLSSNRGNYPPLTRGILIGARGARTP